MYSAWGCDSQNFTGECPPLAMWISLQDHSECSLVNFDSISKQAVIQVGWRLCSVISGAKPWQWMMVGSSSLVPRLLPMPKSGERAWTIWSCAPWRTMCGVMCGFDNRITDNTYRRWMWNGMHLRIVYGDLMIQSLQCQTVAEWPKLSCMGDSLATRERCDSGLHTISEDH